MKKRYALSLCLLAFISGGIAGSWRMHVYDTRSPDWKKHMESIQRLKDMNFTCTAPGYPPAPGVKVNPEDFPNH